MTIEDIERLDKTMLTCADVAPLLGFDANSLRLQAREDPTLLGFPVVVAGTRTMIPKEGFLNYLRFGRPILMDQTQELRYQKEGA